MLPKSDGRTIGIMDSGVGGLSVLRHIWDVLPAENLIYFADQEHVPYGSRPAGEIRQFSKAITLFFLDQEAKVVVVACNTASASSLNFLRRTFPQVPFVGMEPAVKPGAERSTEGKIGILATAGTFGSRRYASLMARYAQGVFVFEDPCPGLVEQIEAGELASLETERILWRALEPMLAAGVDTIILGCTHYPFVLPLIQQLVGPGVSVIDPAPAVARQVKRVLQGRSLLAQTAGAGTLRVYTTGDPVSLEKTGNQLLETPLTITQAHWRDDMIDLLG
jgi:glutamate racemase